MTAETLAANASVPPASSEPVPLPLIGPQTSAPTIPPAKASPLVKSLLGHKWLVALAVLGLLLVGYLGYRHLNGTAVSVELVQRADLLETVVASGHIESPYRVEIASQITGTVVSVAVREGEVVTQGQPLILLRANELQNAAAQARAAEAQASARVRQVRELSLPQALEAERSAQATLQARSRSMTAHPPSCRRAS